jgi:hypothetical protein
MVCRKGFLIESIKEGHMETFWMVIAPGKMNEKYATRDAATEAAKDYLRAIPPPATVGLNEFDERGSTGKARIVWKVLEDRFHYVDTEWS